MALWVGVALVAAATASQASDDAGQSPAQALQPPAGMSLPDGWHVMPELSQDESGRKALAMGNASDGCFAVVSMFKGMPERDALLDAVVKGLSDNGFEANIADGTAGVEFNGHAVSGQVMLPESGRQPVRVVSCFWYEREASLCQRNCNQLRPVSEQP